MKKPGMALLILLFCLASASAQQSIVRQGYAVLTPFFPTSGQFVVSETIGLTLGLASMRATDIPADLATSAILFVNSSELLLRNTGIAFVNPWSSEVRITMTIRRAQDGALVLGPKTIFIAPFRQTTRLISEIFADRPEVIGELTGTLFITSSLPLGMQALCFRGASFTIEPITRAEPITPPPIFLPGVGGSSSILLPQFVEGGGWSTEIVITNLDTVLLKFRLDVFAQDGSPMRVTLNGKTSTSFFDLLVFPGGVLTISFDSQF